MDPLSFAVHYVYLFVTLLSDSLGSTVLAIVALTVIVRLLLIPVGISQTKAEWTRRRLAPALKALQERYKKNPQKLQEKTLELYKSEGTSPFAGFGPALAQAPVLATVYTLFVRVSIDGHANALLAATLLNVPLGAHLVTGGLPGLLIFLALLLIIAASALVTRRMQTVTGWMSWLPLIAVPFAAIVPLAAALYLATSTLWTLAERALLRRIYWREA
jgi:YidC/Oxa1 family membrane protein insertase